MAQHRSRPVVELYERVVEAIHDGTYPPGSTLPSEPELASALGVSRASLREALILLQEDGLLSVRRGVGRTVNNHPARLGLERLFPIEEFPGFHGARVRRLMHAREEPVDVVLQHLWVAPNSTVRFWESLIDVADGPACLLHEWAVADGTLAEAEPILPAILDEATSGSHSMLHAVLRVAPRLPLVANTSVVATVLGRDRGAILNRPAETPAVLATQVVSSDAKPLLMAKFLLPSGAPALQIRQSR